MKHVVMFSGGIASWATAKRVAERHGTDALTLLFADTRIEDDDLFLLLHGLDREVRRCNCESRGQNGKDHPETGGD